MGLFQPLPLSLTTTLSIIKPQPQISPHIHQKMHNRCKNNYIEAFGAVYWAKNAVLNNLRGLQPPLEDEG